MKHVLTTGGVGIGSGVGSPVYVGSVASSYVYVDVQLSSNSGM